MNRIHPTPTTRAMRWASLTLLALLALPAAAQSWEFEMGAGNRDVSGNREMERSLFDEESGLTLGRIWYDQTSFADSVGWLDHLSIEASGFGAQPNGQISLGMERDGWYKLRLKFRELSQYDNFDQVHGAFDEPNLLLEQHSFARTRRVFDLDWKFLPGSTWRPFLNLHWNEVDGSGDTTAHLGQDEFALKERLEGKDSMLEIGLAYRGKRISGELAQGWRNFDQDESAGLLPGNQSGNNPGTVLNVPESLTDAMRNKHRDGDSPTTRLNLKAELHERISLQASYLKSKTEIDADETAAYEGLLLSFRERLTTTRQLELLRAGSDVDQWRGDLRAEVRLPLDFQLDLATGKSERELDAQAVWTIRYEEAFLYGSTEPVDVLTEFSDASHLTTKTSHSEIRLSKSFGHFRAWFAANQSDQDLFSDTINQPDPSDAFVPESRNIDSVGGGISFSKAGLRIVAEAWSDQADGRIFRTDYKDRDRAKLRAKWSFAKWGRLNAAYHNVQKDNPAPELDYEMESKQTSLGLELEPLKALRISGAFNRGEQDSTVWVQRPQRYTEVLSVNKADSKGWNFEALYRWKSIELAGNLEDYKNEGSYESKLSKNRFDIGLLLGNGAKVHLEYGETRYEELQTAVHDFDVKQLTFWFSWRPEK